jgi:hypothetical protein
MSNNAIHDFSRNSVKSGGRAGEGRGGGQIGLPKPSLTASLSGRRQKYLAGPKMGIKEAVCGSSDSAIP